MRECRPPARPGMVTPTPGTSTGSQHQTGKAHNIPLPLNDPAQPQAGPSNRPCSPSPDSDEDEPVSSSNDDDMEPESDADFMPMIKEGGVKFQNFLLTRSIPYSNSLAEFDIQNYLNSFPDSWSQQSDYRNIGHSQEEITKWDQACTDEIDGLTNETFLRLSNYLLVINLLNVDGFLTRRETVNTKPDLLLKDFHKFKE